MKWLYCGQIRGMQIPFSELDPRELQDNAFRLIGDDWMLITAGQSGDFNTMTASWGTLGVLWNLPVAICFVRPQRHTFGFMERSEHYTLNFLEDGHREILRYCGTHSGRDTDKMARTGLLPRETGQGSIFFEQSRLVIECRKLYSDWLREDSFILPGLAGRNYPGKDYHKFYIGEVVSCLVREV